MENILARITDTFTSISPKDLCLVVGGAIASIVLADLYVILKQRPWQREYKQIRSLAGRYYGYHLHTDNSGEIIESIWAIEKKWLRSISVMVEHPELKNEYLYKGGIRFYQSHLYFNLNCITKPEEMYFVFYRPQNGRITIELGTAICIGQTGNPYAGLQIISKYKLSDSQVLKIFSKRSILVVGDREMQRIRSLKIG
jgi:hypothetical protein